jgi:hypothetical protein
MAHEILNGMSAGHLEDAAWRKSSRSGAQGNCVELAWPGSEVVAVRNSRDPRGPVLIYPRSDLAAFLADMPTREV